MDRILMIADAKIFGFGGGSSETHKYFDALKSYSKKYNSELKIIAFDAPDEYSFPFNVKKDCFIDMCARGCFHSTYLFLNWIKFRKKVLNYKPDVLFLERSRMGFMAKWIKRHNCKTKIICFMENIEFDYVDVYFANKGKELNGLFKKLEKICVRRDEKNAIRYSDELLYLTERDYQRSVQLYDAEPQKKNIIPICLKDTIELDKISNIKNVVFIGSLDYEANIMSVKWFVDEIWEPYFENISTIGFIVGGSKPSKELKVMLNEVKNLTLHENFNRPTDIIPKGSLIVAPILAGAGMKVKVAEALSLGLPIVASKEALVGYEDALKSDLLGGVVRADSVGEYVNAINNYLRMPLETIENIKKQNQEIFRRFYSYNISRSTIERVISKWDNNSR